VGGSGYCSHHRSSPVLPPQTETASRELHINALAEQMWHHTMQKMLGRPATTSAKHGIFSRCSSGAAGHSCLQYAIPTRPCYGNQRRLLTRNTLCGVSTSVASAGDQPSSMTSASQGKNPNFNRAPSFNAEPLGDRNILPN